MSALESHEPGQFGDLEERLIARFSPPLRPEEVQRCLAETIVSYQDARVKTYLPVLIERAAVDRLQAILRQGNGSAGATGATPARAVRRRSTSSAREARHERSCEHQRHARHRGRLVRALGRRRLSPAGRRSCRRSERGRGRRAPAAVRSEQAGRGGQGAGLACVPAPVPRPHAAGAGRGGGRQHRRPAGRLDRVGGPRPDGRQRPDGPAPGGQGRRERRRAAGDADHDGERPP